MSKDCSCDTGNINGTLYSSLVMGIVAVVGVIFQYRKLKKIEKNISSSSNKIAITEETREFEYPSEQAQIQIARLEIERGIKNSNSQEALSSSNSVLRARHSIDSPMPRAHSNSFSDNVNINYHSLPPGSPSPSSQSLASVRPASPVRESHHKKTYIATSEQLRELTSETVDRSRGKSKVSGTLGDGTQQNSSFKGVAVEYIAGRLGVETPNTKPRKMLEHKEKTPKLNSIKSFTTPSKETAEDDEDTAQFTFRASSPSLKPRSRSDGDLNKSKLPSKDLNTPEPETASNLSRIEDGEKEDSQISQPDEGERQDEIALVVVEEPHEKTEVEITGNESTEETT